LINKAGAKFFWRPDEMVSKFHWATGVNKGREGGLVIGHFTKGSPLFRSFHCEKTI